jgi:hypothetical protein
MQAKRVFHMLRTLHSTFISQVKAPSSARVGFIDTNRVYVAVYIMWIFPTFSLSLLSILSQASSQFLWNHRLEVIYFHKTEYSFPWNQLLLYWSWNSQPFMEPDVSSPCRHEPVTKTCLDFLQSTSSHSRMGLPINIKAAVALSWPPLWSSGQSSWIQIRRPGFDSRHYQKKKK